jgi:hypothetical protein
MVILEKIIRVSLIKQHGPARMVTLEKIIRGSLQQ